MRIRDLFVTKKYEFYNVYIQLICLLIGAAGLLYIDILKYWINIPSLYIKLFLWIMILGFFARRVVKEESQDNSLISPNIKLIHDGIMFFLFGVTWHFIIFFFWQNWILNSSEHEIVFFMDKSPECWLVHGLNICFVVGIGIWFYCRMRHYKKSKLFINVLISVYCFFVIINIISNIIIGATSLILFFIPFIFLFIIGIYLCIKNKLASHHNQKLVVRESSP